MIAAHDAKQFLEELDAELRGSADPTATAIHMIARTFAHFKWVGVYWLRGEMLELGPYAGPPTEHTRIAVGQGVCGTAIAEGRNQIVPDVRAVKNYLACSTTTRSEIVVLMHRGDEIIGQIDADGDETGAFDTSDEALLTQVAERLGILAS